MKTRKAKIKLIAMIFFGIPARNVSFQGDFHLVPWAPCLPFREIMREPVA